MNKITIELKKKGKLYSMSIMNDTDYELHYTVNAEEK
jgi:hypothetical protein